MEHINTTPKTLRPLLEATIKAKLVPFIFGSPGIGKSAIVQSIADEYNLKLIDNRIASMDATDFTGFPNIDTDKGIASYYPFDVFPTVNTPIPQGYTGWLIFLDEFNSGDDDVLKAAYKFIIDRKVNQTKLHERVVIVCAGNKSTDKAIVNDLGSALQSRFVNFLLDVDATQFIEHAEAAEFDHRVISYLRFRPEMVHKFDPNHDDLTFPCPRTWDMLSSILKTNTVDVTSYDNLPLVNGCIGSGTGREFFNYLKVYRNLPDIQSIIKDPINTLIPVEPANLYALSGVLGESASMQNYVNLLKYAERMTPEFQLITLQAMCRKHPPIRATPETTQLSSKLAELI